MKQDELASMITNPPRGDQTKTRYKTTIPNKGVVLITLSDRDTREGVRGWCLDPSHGLKHSNNTLRRKVGRVGRDNVTGGSFDCVRLARLAPRLARRIYSPEVSKLFHFGMWLLKIKLRLYMRKFLDMVLFAIYEQYN